MIFKLQCVDSHTAFPSETLPLTNTLEFQAVTLPDILQHVEFFLRGCGFSLKNLDYDAD